jgi:FkbM family methyltransferase
MGFDLELDLRDNLQHIVYRSGSYEPNLNERITRELQAGDVYVDIGAHIGIHALAAARQLQLLGGGHVYAFEPAADSCDRLARAIEHNGIGNLTLLRAAVGETTGQIELRSDPAFDPADAGVRSAFASGPMVGVFPMVRFDEWAAEAGLSRLDIVKIDIEGGETSALVGMRETLARLRPRLLVTEVNEHALERAGMTRERLYDELARSNYAPTESIRDHDTVENVTFAPRPSFANRF